MKHLPRYIDLAFCLFVLPLMATVFPVERWFHNFPWYVLSVGTWFYALYFLNRFITVPWLFRHGWHAAGAIAMTAASVAVTAAFSGVTLYTPRLNVHDYGITRLFPYLQQYQQAVWSLFMIVFAFSFAVGLLTQAARQSERRRAVEAERDKAELCMYKARIKPHFMFNTLNSLYGLFLTGSDNALPSLEKFIAMLRYIHSTAECDLVPVADEAAYITRYVELQSLRLNGMTTVTFNSSIEPSSAIGIPPMLLVTFVENCFKHGVSPVEKSDIHISLSTSGSVLRFTTCNRVFNVKHPGENMGIDNCRKRLALLYPGHHRLHIAAGPDYFKVELNIGLK